MLPNQFKVQVNLNKKYFSKGFLFVPHFAISFPLCVIVSHAHSPYLAFLTDQSRWTYSCSFDDSRKNLKWMPLRGRYAQLRLVARILRSVF